MPRKNVETPVSLVYHNFPFDYSLVLTFTWKIEASVSLWCEWCSYFLKQNTPEEDFSEPISDEHSVQNEFISDSFAQTEQGTS